MRRAIGWTVLGVVVLVGAGLAWIWFSGGSGEPSTDLTTPEITDGTGGATSTMVEGSGSTVTDGGTAYVISKDDSTVSFEIDEVLRGSPNHVVGSTSEVAGQVEFDPADLSAVAFSQIVVNARTFATDSGLRDRAIRSPTVLGSESDEFELITFDVTSVDGLSGAAGVGDQKEFTVSGDLTIKGVTAPATFEVTATLIDDTHLEGTAQATVTRSTFGIGIPSVPSVADVSDEVLIELDFVAVGN